METRFRIIPAVAALSVAGSIVLFFLSSGPLPAIDEGRSVAGVRRNVLVGSPLLPTQGEGAP